MVSSPRHSQRPRPAAYWAILDFHAHADHWFEGTRLPGAARILDSLRRALMALTHAMAGRDAQGQLARVFEAMDECRSNFMLLHAHRPALADEGYRRIDRIVSMLNVLQHLEPSVWPNVAPPPIPTSPPPRSRTVEATPKLRGKVPRKLLN